MSVLIKDMGKPKSCRVIIDGKAKYCPFVNTDDDCVLLLEKGICEGTWEDQYANCPLVELPEKHGKLIDGIELINYCKDMINLNHTPGYNRDTSLEERVYTNIIGHIINMPTVIEAEGKE